MNKEILEQIDNHLYEWGFRKNTGAQKGWYWRIQMDGPPGLTHDEQEINRRGGRYCGANSIALLEDTYTDIKGTLLGYTKEEIEENHRFKYEYEWVLKAKHLLQLAREEKL